MAKLKTVVKRETAKKVSRPMILQKGWQHGDVADIPTGKLVANDWNPNEMSADEFDMLSENVDDVGFLQPLLVVPRENEAKVGVEYGGDFLIIDGEHRYEQQRLMDVPKIKCVVADPARMDEVERMKQTIRMNKIKGKMSATKFRQFVDRFVDKADIDPVDVPHALGFIEESEFEELLDQARDSLPDGDMKKEFDKARDEIKTVDDLSHVLNRLFTQFGDTLPANFMILDFGSKEHVWVRMGSDGHRICKERFRSIFAKGYTVDSVLERMIMLLDVDDFVDAHSDFLEQAEVRSREDDIDSILEE